jgi:DNA repair protein RadC
LRQAELLAIVIGSGVRGRNALAIANAVLDAYIGLYGIHRDATVEDLAKIPGLGKRKAERILAAIGIGRRLYHLRTRKKPESEPQGALFDPINRPCEKETDPPGPSEVDLLGAIVGSGLRGRSPRAIAQDLLSRYGSISGLYEQDMGGLLRVKGLDSVKAIRIAAALEIAARIVIALS